MPRPIVLTEEIKQDVLKDFTSMLENVKMSDGKLSYSKSYEYKNCSAVVWLTKEAHRKILALVMGFEDEVGWHGTVSRSKKREFVIGDIFVYPQEVTGSTVTTDQSLYNKWLYELDDETFNSVRMQGHSHVNMRVFPSGIDNKHREQILEQLESDMFYIFMIWNKSLDVHTLIYDMQNNILFENKDIDIRILEDDAMSGFLVDAKTKVQKAVNTKKKIGSKNNKKFGFVDDEFFPEAHNYLGGIWNL